MKVEIGGTRGRNEFPTALHDTFLLVGYVPSGTARRLPVRGGERAGSGVSTPLILNGPKGVLAGKQPGQYGSGSLLTRVVARKVSSEPHVLPGWLKLVL